MGNVTLQVNSLMPELSGRDIEIYHLNAFLKDLFEIFLEIF